jgi:hypothetical protein
MATRVDRSRRLLGSTVNGQRTCVLLSQLTGSERYRGTEAIRRRHQQH